MKLMSESDRQCIGACLRAAANGPLFEEWEFRTLFGLDRDQLRSVATMWPDVDESDETVRLAIHNTLVNLIGYPLDDEALVRHTGTNRESLEKLFQRWRADSHGGSTFST